MGNAESTSSLPSHKADDEERDDDASLSLGSVLQLGAAAAGASILAYGAWNRLSSSDSDRPDGRTAAVQQQRGGFSGSNNYSTINRGHERTSQDVVPRMVKIMTFNVWFREDVELRRRMQAVCNIVEEHKPHIIFFQEVTLSIYDIFSRHHLWKDYNCSVTPEKAAQGNFCVVLSKLPVGVFLSKPFTVGGNLKMAMVDVGMGKWLTVATSHLKSPSHPQATGTNRSSDSVHSTKRSAQANEAIKFLDSWVNVVFGGDMNWDEDVDGPFPLSTGWTDAWTHLMPNEGGHTFDTESNPMLRGRRLLQKRPDRFVCKLKDFMLSNVKIIGKEEIPGASYTINKNRLLPVLPSDHYGLLLTICPKQQLL